MHAVCFLYVSGHSLHLMTGRCISSSRDSSLVAQLAHTGGIIACVACFLYVKTKGDMTGRCISSSRERASRFIKLQVSQAESDFTCVIKTRA